MGAWLDFGTDYLKFLDQVWTRIRKFSFVFQKASTNSKSTGNETARFITNGEVGIIEPLLL